VDPEEKDDKMDAVYHDNDPEEKDDGLDVINHENDPEEKDDHIDPSFHINDPKMNMDAMGMMNVRILDKSQGSAHWNYLHNRQSFDENSDSIHSNDDGVEEKDNDDSAEEKEEDNDEEKDDENETGIVIMHYISRSFWSCLTGWSYVIYVHKE
jgi:hypothetical protein